jgi:hypothetical protein
LEYFWLETRMDIAQSTFEDAKKRATRARFSFTKTAEAA